jgi:hypothetical protein
LQTWSMAEIVRLVQEFGYPVRISPYALPAGEFREIRLTLEDEHPRDIAKKILFRKGQYATFIEVYIHDWMKIANGPPPSPQGGQGFNRGTHQAGGMGQHQEAQQHQARRSSGSSNVTPSDNLFPSVLQRRAGRGDRGLNQSKMISIPKETMRKRAGEKLQLGRDAEIEGEQHVPATQEIMIGSMKIEVPILMTIKESQNKIIKGTERPTDTSEILAMSVIVSMESIGVAASCNDSARNKIVLMFGRMPESLIRPNINMFQLMLVLGEQ